MTNIVRRPYASASLKGVSVGQILSARCSFGFDMRVSEAYITVSVPPSVGSYWDPVVLNMGANQSSAATRFTGVLLEYDYSLWPRAVTLVCRGNLYRAAVFTNPTMSGTDLSNGNTGQSDVGMVRQVLGAVPGLVAPAYFPGNIGGTGKLLGTKIVNFVSADPVNGNLYIGPFTWGGPGLLNQGIGEQALSVIERLDSVSEGFRVFETTGGTIYRFQISGRPNAVPQLYFTEGLDIVEGSSSRSLIAARNRFVVSGYDFGTGLPVNIFIQPAAPFTPGLDQTMAFSSPMIEKAHILDPGLGQSCEAMSLYLKGEYDREIVRLRMVTPRDDLIGPGQTHLVQGNVGGQPGRLGIGEPLWVLHVDVEISARGAFRQTVTYLGGGLPDSTPPAPVL